MERKDKMDLMWGLEQLEKHLAKHYSPATNIMNIATEVQIQVKDLKKNIEDLKLRLIETESK